MMVLFIEAWVIVWLSMAPPHDFGLLTNELYKTKAQCEEFIRGLGAVDDPVLRCTRIQTQVTVSESVE